MGFYYASIGSNLSPEVNVARALQLVLARFGSVYIFPPAYTAPEGMRSSKTFVNAVFFFDSDAGDQEVKAFFNQVEELLGRDRNNPLKKVLDRPCDIDILGFSPGVEAAFRSVPCDPYIRQVLDYRRSVKAPVFLFGEQLPQRPSAIHFQGCTRHKVVVNQGFNGLDQRFKPPFLS